MSQGQPPHQKDKTRCGLLVWVKAGQCQTHFAARTAKKCRGGFLPRILGWEHCIPFPLPSPNPLEDERQQGESHCVPFLKIPPLSWAAFYDFFFCLHLTSWFYLVVTALDFHVTLTSHFYFGSVLTPSSCCDFFPVFCLHVGTSEGSTRSRVVVWPEVRHQLADL